MAFQGIAHQAPAHKLCDIKGCGKRARSGSAAFCEAHYMKQRRHGSPTFVVVPEPVTEHTGGYRLAYAPGHPLCTPGQSRIYEHRKVFYDAKGSGPFRCHVCDATIGWEMLHVDHLDDDPTNNDLSNLAPACPTCNQGRGFCKMVATHRARATHIKAFGASLTISEWSQRNGIPRTTIIRRLSEGWAAEAAVGTPPGPTGRKAVRHA